MNITAPQINWHEVQTVLLDMDGTLLDLHYDHYFWCEYLPLKISQRDGTPLQATKDAVIPQLMAAIGTLEFYCIDHWSAVFQLDILALKQEIAGKIAVRRGVREFLRWLKKSHKRIVLATNAHRATIDMKLHKTQLAEYFDAICCSHDYGHPKEHSGYWQALTAQAGINLPTSLFIDDTERVLLAAQASGVRYIIGIQQPDSQRPALEHSAFAMTNDFSELRGTY